MPLVVLCFSISLRNGSNPAAVGAKLRCALCAEKANRNRGSTKKGVPHLIASSASGATLLRIAYSRRKCGWPSHGAARIYSAIVVGRLLAISFASITDACCRAPNDGTQPRRANDFRFVNRDMLPALPGAGLLGVGIMPNQGVLSL